MSEQRELLLPNPSMQRTRGKRPPALRRCSGRPNASERGDPNETAFSGLGVFGAVFVSSSMGGTSAALWRSPGKGGIVAPCARIRSK
jgi:hypothetical protein